MQELILKGQRAKEFLEWFDEFECSVRSAIWGGMKKHKLAASELYNLNSVAVLFGMFRDFLVKTGNNGAALKGESMDE